MRFALAAPLATSLIAACCCLAPAGASAFDFDDVADQARKLADEPYRKPSVELPRELKDLNYDQYRDIRFRVEHALWRGTKIQFEIQFFHPGLYYTTPVRINLITAEGVRPLRFQPANFDYGHNKLNLDKLKDVGFAGFRVHYPLNRKDYKDEIAVFLGATYFRALGTHQRYGLSARGLAVDTAMLSGEEFPAFTEFWITWPAPGAKDLEIYALLDSKRVTGAYRFVLRPGKTTEMDVRARLFLRDPVGKLGIAPLTSMFDFGENQPGPTDDFRPEVHDSDGLLVRADNGEWIWRPLVNPKRLLVSSFHLINPRGFGLMQRDRYFDHYEDLESRYDLRPSVWVTPEEDWGPGRVELVELPTPDETNDNIVAYWIPDQTPPPGKPLDLRYLLSWQRDEIIAPPNAWVRQSRRGYGFRKSDENTLQFTLDFTGPALDKLPPDVTPNNVVWVGEPGELIERQLFRNEADGGWRLVLRLRRKDESQPVEMRAALRQGDEALSETWSYILP